MEKRARTKYNFKGAEQLAPLFFILTFGLSCGIMWVSKLKEGDRT